MIRATRELLAALARVNREAPTVALRIMDESLPAADQVAFGQQLIELGQAVQRHALAERAEVIDHVPELQRALSPVNAIVEVTQ
jgi:hypothetical protein